MLLCESLSLGKREMVAVVGAGGKTAVIERLASELATSGRSVVCTTTTAIWQPEGPLIVEADEERLLSAVADGVKAGLSITVAAGRFPVTQDGRWKLRGLSPDLPQRLLDVPGVDYVLVEADGARGLTIKAPAEHEPVIPPSATCVVVIVGIDALGEPLEGAIAHRPERIAHLVGIPIGTPLSPRHIAALLMHPQGGRKNVPAVARFVPFINKVQEEMALRGARAIAAHLRGQPGVDRVVIGAALAARPVLEVWQ